MGEEEKVLALGGQWSMVKVESWTADGLETETLD